VPSWAGYRDLLRNRRFLKYEASAISASLGYSVYAISIPWLALQFSGSLLVVGLVLFAEYGIYALTFLVAPWVDRARNKRTIYLACYPVQAVAAAAIALGLTDHLLTPLLLLGLVAFISLLWDFVWASNNIVPRLLLAPDDLFRAQGLGSLLGGIAQVGGYAAGAISLVLVGPSGGMFLYAGLLAAGTGIAATVSLPSPPSGARPDYWKEFREGWKHFSRRAARTLFPLGTSELLRGFFVAAPPLVITLLAARVLAEGTSGYSELYAAWVAGGIAVGLLLGALNPRHRIGSILVGAALAEGLLVLAAVTFASDLLPGVALWFAIGAAGSAYLSCVSTFLQGSYPPETLGRITANLYVFTGVASATGALVLGALANTWPPVAFGALVAAGFLGLAGVVVSRPSIRRLAF
jgi:hypothetical protein